MDKKWVTVAQLVPLSELIRMGYCSSMRDSNWIDM